MKEEEETFQKMFGERVEETLREISEEGVAARARKIEAIPSKRRWRSATWIALR